MTSRLVVIGAGMASGRLLEELLKKAAGAYDITLFGAENYGNYNRILLSPVLAGETVFKDIITHDADWYRDRGITCRFGETVLRIDRKKKQLISTSGVTDYDQLVIATGSSSAFIPVVGKNLPGVIGFRDYEDVTQMLKAARKPGGKAVIIGGGLLGLEAAAALNNHGMKTTVLHLMGHLMDRQLDPTAGALLQKDLENRGIKIICNAHTKAILGHDHVDAVVLDDGTLCGADLVVMAAGIRPETSLATDAGLHVERGIVVDDAMQTSDPSIFAVGECVEHNSIVYGLVAPLFDMAKVLASTLIDETACFVAPVVSTKLKVTGVNLFSVGDFKHGNDREDIVFRDPACGIYKRIILQSNRVIGAVMYGDTSHSKWFVDLLKAEQDIGGIRDTLIFGSAFKGNDICDPPASDTRPAKAGIILNNSADLADLAELVTS